ncbi:MAG TPA: energy transducer TonB [Vicinamibacteria bacterium]|nr:energy transducer TonB [Vicinamibacteria bacterium]
MRPRTSSSNDGFKRMLGWSLVAHLSVLVLAGVAASFQPTRGELPVPVGTFINVSLGDSGPNPGMGGGPPKETPEPPAPKTPEPEPEPEPEPKVVRPTVEQREELPLPDAPVRRSPDRKPAQDSGLRGQDAASAESAQLRTAGPPGLGLGGTGGGSAFDQDFEYAYYVRQMLAKIHQHWQRTAVRGTAVVVIRFTIARDGSVLDAEVETSSGVSILDRSSLRAVVLSEPLPPLPNSYPRDQVGVHLRFTYTDQP